jgi:hypothetical protein
VWWQLTVASDGARPESMVAVAASALGRWNEMEAKDGAVPRGKAPWDPCSGSTDADSTGD